MGKIYKNAECVLVWLSKSNEAIDAGIVAIRELADSAWKFGLKYDRDSLRRLSDIQLKFNTPDKGITAALIRLSSELDFESINAFTNQKWFTRLWIIQEYALASKVQIVNGHKTFSHEDLFLAMAVLVILAWLPRRSITKKFYRGSFWDAWAIILAREIPRDIDLLALLNSCSGRRCKLDQDRIYGLLALAAPGPGSDLEINYRLSFEHVYKQLALAYLKVGNLNILKYPLHRKRDCASPDIDGGGECDPKNAVIPSWVPDWRVIGDDTMLLPAMVMEACTKVIPRVSTESYDPDMVGIEGVFLDFVEETLLVGSHETMHELQSAPVEIARVLKLKDTFTKKTVSHGYPTGEDSDVAFARCLLLDNRMAPTQIRYGPSISHEVMLNKWSEWYGCVSDWAAPEDSNANYSSALLKKVKNIPYTEAILTTGYKRAYMITKTGYIGLGPLQAAAGDAITVFNGASAPCVLRKVLHKKPKHPTVDMEDVEKWEIVGNCYIQGCMENEVSSPKWQEKKEMFWIV